MVLVAKIVCWGSESSGLTLWGQWHSGWAHSPQWPVYRYMSVLSTITNMHSHQHFCDRQPTGRKIISNNWAYHHSSCWQKVTNMENSMLICDLHLHQQEEGQNNQVQGQQNAVCRVPNFKLKRCSLERGSSGDLNKAVQSRVNLDFPLAHC